MNVPTGSRALLGLALATTLVAVSLPAEATRRALLIGINDYAAVPKLNGAINDTAMIREILISRFGFEAANVEMLLDQAATRAAILDALDGLAEASQPEDVVYIHFSGHGSQVADLDGDESDQLDETIVPQNGRLQGIPDITDDELADRFAKVRGKAVVVTLDSCHSGTATRDVRALRSRYVPRDHRSQLYADRRTRAVVPLASTRHTLLAGAASNQEALDGPVDGKSYGLFSYSLGRALSSAPAGASPRVLLRQVQQELERIKAQLNLADMPEPQLEGRSDRLDAALFPSASNDAPRLAWLAAEPHDGGVRLVNGPSLGALPGSVWAVYDKDEMRFAPGGALAEVVVEEIAGGDAIARVESGRAPSSSPGRAVAIAPAPVDDRVTVRWIDPDAKRSERMKAAIRERLDSVAFVETEFARFVVEADSSLAKVSGADGVSEIASYSLENEAQVVGSLVTLFARSLTASELLSISNAAGALSLYIQVVGIAPLGSAESDDAEVEAVKTSNIAPRLQVRRQDEARSPINSLQLAVSASEDCSLTVVDVDTEGGVTLLFPNSISEERGFLAAGRIEAGKRVLIPDSLEPQNAAGFYFDYAPPAGTDTIRGFCFRSAENAGAFQSAVARLEAELGTRSTSASASRSIVRRVLLQELAPALNRSASRGIKIVAAEEPVPEPEPLTEPEPTPEPAAASQDEPPPAPAPELDWTATSLTLVVVE